MQIVEWRNNNSFLTFWILSFPVLVCFMRYVQKCMQFQVLQKLQLFEISVTWFYNEFYKSGSRNFRNSQNRRRNSNEQLLNLQKFPKSTTKFKWVNVKPIGRNYRNFQNQRRYVNELLLTLITEIAEISKIDDEIQRSNFDPCWNCRNDDKPGYFLSAL